LLARNIWSGRYYGNDTPPAGGFLVALQDTDGDGRADVKARFGDGVATGSAGGTGVALYNGWLYAEVNDRIVRYALLPGSVAPTGARPPLGPISPAENGCGATVTSPRSRARSPTA